MMGWHCGAAVSIIALQQEDLGFKSMADVCMVSLCLLLLWLPPIAPKHAWVHGVKLTDVSKSAIGVNMTGNGSVSVLALQ